MATLQQIAVAQSAFVNGDVICNLNKMDRLVRQCLSLHPKVRLIVFPELAATGYLLSPQAKDLAQLQTGEIYISMRETAIRNGVWIVYGYVERDEAGHVYNAIQMIDPSGGIAGNYRKIHLTPLEKSWFRPGSDLVAVRTDVGVVGLMICWDLAFPELARSLVLQGADLIAAPSAWETPYDSPFVRFGAARAIDNTVYVAACNHIGTSGELSFFGKSAIYAPDGATVCMAEENEERIVAADLDYEWRDEIKSTFFTMLADRRPDTYWGLMR
ncbi:carbon-nitrogen hydrolase family protein [Cohnella panacarvi]|uniref:carbon-nitrogen hydrolase family protein n=1 Tax=Cohnella panacarvi TaxID=400776 RepID=UPI00047EB313|nr:carbon-nitrogen hydrolase family protein [Cohnella panacarvi]